MYAMLIKFGFRQQLQYRAGMVLGLLGDGLRMYIRGCIWWALLATGASAVGAVGPEGAEGARQAAALALFQDTAFYTLVSAMLLILTETRIAGELADRVKSGMVAVDMIRPISLKWYYFFSQLGENLVRFAVEGAVLIPLAFWMWELRVPKLSYIILGVISSAGAMALLFSIQYLIGLLVFWMKDGTYTRMIMNSLFVLFSGSSIPLWFYPDWLAEVCRSLPFCLTLFEPAQIWLGKYSTQECVRILVWQAAWILAVTVMERGLWRRMERHIEIQGG